MITSPLDIPGGNCVVWLDASDTTTLFQLSDGTTAVAANLDPVGYWGDKSGNIRHFTNIGGSASTRPTWIAALSTVRFDGINDYLSSFFNLTYTAQTVFLVLTKISGAAGSIDQRVYTQNSSTGQDIDSNRHIPCWVPNGARGTYSSYTNSNNRSSVTNRGNNIYDIFTSRFAATELTNFLNGAASSSVALTLNLAVTLSRLGARIAGGVSEHFAGDISEVIVYDKALSNAEREDVEYYLTRKWSVLNSIPRQVYAIQNGNWSNSTTWSTSADPAPWTFPLSSDNVYSNTFTVTADSSTKVDTIRNSTLAPNISSGGSFVLANGVSLSATIQGTANLPPFATLSSGVTATLVGNIVGPGVVSSIDSPTLTVLGDGCLTVYGNVFGGGGVNNGFLRSVALLSNSTGKLTIYGSVIGGNGFGSYGGAGLIVAGATRNVLILGNVSGGGREARGIHVNAPNANIAIIGDVTSGTNVTDAFGISLTNFTSLSVVGNVNLNSSAGITGGAPPVSITSSGTGIIFIEGNLRSSLMYPTVNLITMTNGAAVIRGSLFCGNGSNLINCTATTPLSVYGNIINAPNGRQAIYAPRYQVFPTGSAQYTRHASNGYDSYLDYWTSNATFTYPASSDVVSNTTYNNNALTGSMALPSPSAVFLNCPVGSTATTIFQITTGNSYLITSNPFNTNFGLVGASSNIPGTIFTATSAITPSTPLTAYNSDTGRVVPLGTSTPPTVDSFWNKALTELTLPSNTVGGKLKNVVTTQQLSSIYTGLIYTAPGNF